jgi:hypothetical protein
MSFMSCCIVTDAFHWFLGSSTILRHVAFGMTAPSPPKLHLDSTQDLLARLHLHSAYDRYVRPLVLPGNEPTGSGMGAGMPGTPGDKGKGKEVDGGMETLGQDGGLGGGDGDGDDEDGKGEKRRKNSYKHLIKGLPGAF